MATALVPVFTGTLADRTTQLCDARTLHTFMQVKRDFTTWIKARIRKFGFVAGEDFITVQNLSSPDLVSAKSRAQKLADYHLTLDMAKELAMVENNEQGRAARRYFIECERQALAVAAPQATPYTVQPSDTLSEPQQIALRALLESNVKRLPHAKQAGAMVKGWSKLKAHFGVPYRQIPASEFTEAISIVARHVAEWELVEDNTPKSGTVPEIVAEWVEKIEEPNGYPAMLFMPLVNAVLRKMGFTLPGAELPRLAMTMTPPPIGSYKYDRANPYPRNGRTVEVAKSIVTDIQSWGHSLPNSPAKRDLIDATDTLYSLLVSGWTEVDEALGQISTAMHYLNRWQGRGGRLWNVS